MHSWLAALLVSAAPTVVLAQTAAESEVYTLGELHVTAQSRTGEALGGSVTSGDTLQTFNKQTVDQALSLVPGVNASNTGGSRNERVVYVRGFDRFQTTLSIDGVRVFLPADNRIDFARFLTADLAEIQISKGYVSVLDGPGGLGGAINLVTVKPTAELEGEIQASAFFNRKLESEGQLLSGRVGGRTGDFYWQASGSYMDRDHFTLSDNFKPTPLEDGGVRENSQTSDWRINLKAGWQPNDTDEYSINYTRSEGEKNAPYSVSDPNSRYWKWPYYNISSVALLTRTQVAEGLTLRTRLYHNTFDNLLQSFDDPAQTRQSIPRAFDSYYQDHATGGNIQLDYDLSPTSRLKGVFYARRDVHHERQDGFIRTPSSGSPSINTPYSEPWQTNDENTYSLAGEYTTALSPAVELVLGASYDWTDLRVANDMNVSVSGATIANSVINMQPVHYALRNNEAWNGQAALLWRLDEATRLHASVSSRARFPTVFERFSSRFGAAIPNPDVREERATNFEVGADLQVTPDINFTGAVFYADLQNALIQIPVVVPGFGTVNQTKNAADGHYYGFEASAHATLTDTLEAGGNLTYLHRKLKDPTNPDFRPTGVPDWKLFAYAAWSPAERLTIRPSVEYADERWTVTTTSPLTYYRTGSYTLLNLSADYQVTDDVTLTLAAQNIGDQDYQLTDGFPEAGRSFYASVRARF
ncbi:MAG: TonB-dependent receptor [Phenylobacterium sp.]|jgi:iron complex outermembrane receptor protein|uniref:TonB-dependent receptor plug domain-containing protein n=1 Tax=Phenylobacterium sp. TaxID=1871053 RepID=UPI002A37054D|nr:TonB-dependent receptor [Phenylobacterium sp.]MDX9998624.1 TonB-dependent receptor [Phenylobacterium sp.]